MTTTDHPTVPLFQCRLAGCKSDRLPRSQWCADHRYPEPREDGWCLYTGCGYRAEAPSPWCHSHTRRGEQGDELMILRAVVARAAFIAETLMAMIDQDTWRDQGGDDGQGHYEGDYYAERLAAEIERWKTEATSA